MFSSRILGQLLSSRLTGNLGTGTPPLVTVVGGQQGNGADGERRSASRGTIALFHWPDSDTDATIDVSDSVGRYVLGPATHSVFDSIGKFADFICTNYLAIGEM